MHGELPGAASAFLSVASRVEVATFFRYLREDVSQVDDDDLQAVFQLAFGHLPILAHRALGRAMAADPEPMGSPILWDRDRFLERADLQLGDQQLTPSPADEGDYRDRPAGGTGGLQFDVDNDRFDDSAPDLPSDESPGTPRPNRSCPVPRGPQAPPGAELGGPASFSGGTVLATSADDALAAAATDAASSAVAEMQKVQRQLQFQMQQLAAEGAAQRNENYNLAEANRRQQAELNELRDPRRRMEELQRLVIEPAMQEILKGKLSAVEIQRMRAYRIDDAVVDKLLELRILPPGWKTKHWASSSIE
jgi:hypothetical protein